MANVQMKSYLKCNKSRPLSAEDIPSPKHSDDSSYKKKKKPFPVKYCPDCETAWEDRAHYPDFPMKRQLDHSICPPCRMERRRDRIKKDIVRTEIIEAAHLITNYQKEEGIETTR